jgi:hypothetical protein
MTTRQIAMRLKVISCVVASVAHHRINNDEALPMRCFAFFVLLSLPLTLLNVYNVIIDINDSASQK